MKLRNDRWPLIVLTLLSTFVFFRSINEFPLRNWDEAWYAEISKNMATNNTGLLMPFWNGKYYFDKPPMYFWLSYPIFKIFGPGEWQARAVSTTAAVLTVLMIFVIGKKLFNNKIGIVSAIIFLTLGQVVERFSHGNLDALLTLFSLLSFYFYIKRHTFAAGIFLAGAVLTKGVVFGLYPLVWICVFEFLLGKKKIRKIVKVGYISLIASSWWFILGSLKFGEEFIRVYILDPFAGNLTWKNPEFDFNLLKVFFRDIGFWLIPTALYFFKSHKNKTFLFLLITVIFFVLPLNFLADKLGWFLLPIYPFISIIISLSVINIFTSKPHLISFLVIIILQLNLIKNIENDSPDQSYVGANLGMFIRMNLDPEANIILDSPDFPSFIYYSGLDEVTVTIQNGGKTNEWWIVSHDDISEFKDYIIITKDPQKFNKDMRTITTAPYGYKLLKL